MEIAVMAGLLAEGDMDIDAGHAVAIIDGTKIARLVDTDGINPFVILFLGD
jgi:hypothetical protein